MGDTMDGEHTALYIFFKSVEYTIPRVNPNETVDSRWDNDVSLGASIVTNIPCFGILTMGGQECLGSGEFMENLCTFLSVLLWN